MPHPNIQFKVNKDLDTWTAKEFSVGTEETVNTFYNEQEKELQGFSVNAKQEWDKVFETFFKIMSELFKEHPWPEGEYVVYVSMFNCNPRFLNNKTFQVYYKHSAGSNYVTAHELMHFMFYDYALKHHANLFKDNDTETGIFWDTAEIFNTVLLHSPPFLPIHTAKEHIAYPEHKPWIGHLTTVWEQNQDIDKFIIEIHTFLLTKNSS